MNIKIMKREEAESKGLLYFYTGKECKWGSKSPRFTNKGKNNAIHNLGLEYASAGMCIHCAKLMQSNDGMIGESFEEIMSKWDNTTHKPDTKKLPYLKGTKTMGYAVRGFTYISAKDYKKCSKLMWIKVKGYIKASCSRINIRRAGIPLKEIYGDSLFLHRFILRLVKQDTNVGDHKNGYTLDNRRVSLRVCTAKENCYNTRKTTKGSSEYKGVGEFNNGKRKGHGARNFRWMVKIIVYSVTVKKKLP